MKIKRITKFEEILATGEGEREGEEKSFFPQSQQELDEIYFYLLNDSFYGGFRKLLGYSKIAEIQIVAKEINAKPFHFLLFKVLFLLAKQEGFARIAMRFDNERLKQICLKRGWATPWGAGYYINKGPA